MSAQFPQKDCFLKIQLLCSMRKAPCKVSNGAGNFVLDLLGLVFAVCKTKTIFDCYFIQNLILVLKFY